MGQGGQPVSFVLALILGLGVQQNTTYPALDDHWVFMSEVLEWESSYKDPELPQFQFAPATVVVFYPSGEFASLSSLVRRDGKNSPISIMSGEGYSISKGRWSRNADGSITTRSRVVYREKLPKSNTPVPRPVREEEWLPQGTAVGRLAAKFESGSKVYLPTPSLRLEHLSQLLNDPVVPSPDIR
jgi:hypothetical protein